MQAFAYRHLVPAHALEVVMGGNARPFASDAIRILSATPVAIPSGGSVRVRVATPSPAFANRFKLALRGAPDGITLRNVSPADQGIELEIAAAEGMKAGATGNLIVDVTPNGPPAGPNQKKPPGQQSGAAAATLPAIPYKVVAD